MDLLTDRQPAPEGGSGELTMVEVTQLLRSWSGGSRESLDRLVSALYVDLKRMASKTGAAPDDTMQATVIVNEFYLRLLGQPSPRYENRAHFFSLAARVMRQIRIDHARRGSAMKRGGDAVNVAIAGDAIAAPQDATSELLHDALNTLEGFDRRKAAMLDLRYFAGFSMQEVASALNLSTETVRKEFRLAEAWLASHLAPTP